MVCESLQNLGERGGFSATLRRPFIYDSPHNHGVLRYLSNVKNLIKLMSRLTSRIASVAFAFVLAAVVQTNASAQSFVLEFGRGGAVASDGSVFRTSSLPNTSVTLEIYLTQIAPETRLQDDATGVALADFTVDVTSGGTQLTPTAFTFGPGLVDDLSGNSQITGQQVRLAMIELNGLGQTGATTATDGVNDNSVLLGSVTYDIGANPAASYTVTAQSVGGLSPFAVADPVFPVGIPVTTNTAVVSTPEPSHAIMLAMGSMVCGYGYRRRKKNQAAKETQPQA